MADETLPKWNNCLTLLHSEQPKLRRVLAVLSATGLRLQFAHKGASSFLYQLTSTEKGGKNENSRVASPESVSIFLNPIALRVVKTLWSFGRSECNRDEMHDHTSVVGQPFLKGRLLRFLDVRILTPLGSYALR